MVVRVGDTWFIDPTPKNPGITIFLSSAMEARKTHIRCCICIVMKKKVGGENRLLLLGVCCFQEPTVPMKQQQQQPILS